MWGFETRSSCSDIHGAALPFHGSRDTVCNIDVRVRAEFGTIDGGMIGVAEEVESSVGRLLLLVEADSLSMR